MLAEALVIFACVNSTGCKETSSHYYNTNPELRDMVEKNEKKVEEFVGPTVLQAAGPLLFAAVGGTGTIRIDSNFALQLSAKSTTLVFNREF